MKTLYIAKEPGLGVRDDLSRISGEVTIVDCLNGYLDWYRKKGYNCISRNDFFDSNDMQFDSLIGNPPYQAPNLTGKKGKGGNNSLYIKFIEQGIERVKNGGKMQLLTPPAALIKSTVLHQPTPTLKMLVDNGSLDEIDLTMGKHFDVGSFISRWTWVKGKKQGKVKVTTEDCVRMMDITQLYYLPPKFTDLELNLYDKITNNKDGDQVIVTRSDVKRIDGTIARFGYPKVQLGGSGSINFYAKDYNFLKSNLGLWLLDYIRRHDQQIYHKAFSGICIPDGGFQLTEEEQNHIDNNHWVNFSRKENEEQA